MFLYTSYSASIVALLQSSTASINTLDDLLHSRLQLGVHDIVYNHHYFKTSTDPVRKAIYQQKVVPPGEKARFYSLEEGVKRMRKGLFAFHMEASPGYQLVSETFAEDEKCGFKEIKFIPVVVTYLAIQRQSPYREMLKVGYRKIWERGLQARTRKRYYTEKPECNSHGSNFVSVGLIDFYPALLVLLYGLACAIAVLVLEVLAHKKNELKLG